MMNQPIRASSVPRCSGWTSERSQREAIRQMSRRKKISTASSVPIWITAVNAAPGVAPAEQLGVDAQVGAAGDRQELGEPLDGPEHDGLEEVQHGARA